MRHYGKFRGSRAPRTNPVHVPGYLDEQVYGMLSAWGSAGKITGPDLCVLDQEASEFLEDTGGCEKIQNTLISPSFSSLSRHALALYLLYLLWSLASDLEYFTIPLTILFA